MENGERAPDHQMWLEVDVLHERYRLMQNLYDPITITSESTLIQVVSKLFDSDEGDNQHNSTLTQLNSYFNTTLTRLS